MILKINLFDVCPAVRGKCGSATCAKWNSCKVKLEFYDFSEHHLLWTASFRMVPLTLKNINMNTNEIKTL